MSYWHCKNGEVKEVSESEAKFLKLSGENVTSDPFKAAVYLDECNY